MENDQIKTAFFKVKQDILFLSEEFSLLKSEISEIKILLRALHDELNTQKLHILAQNPLKSSNISQTDRQTLNSTLRQINSTHSVNTTDNSTVPQEIRGLKTPNLGISTGNEGVSTDRQTDTSTDNSTHNFNEKPLKSIESNIQEASEILSSLDRLKKEIRLKFKKVTPQEMAVFSTIYQLEEQDPINSTYQQIAKILHLSQSSIRDYVQRMIDKGIPLKKEKINNKKLLLSISPDLKKIATLSTIIQLREL